MTWVTPRTWVTGELVTAALVNTHLRDDMTFLGSPPACKVTHSATQAVTSAGAGTTLAYNTETYDNDGMHSTVTNNSRITFNTAGIYSVTVSFEMDARADYLANMARIRLNATTTIAHNNNGSVGSATYTAAVVCETKAKFVATDFVDSVALQQNTAAASANVLATSNLSPFFMAHWLGFG